ncbi:hypothetical protein F7734_23765 [Scytonema sp. UIC 10036]|uniref:hypothetical protein n=1 Tax=Scytonema sp. UIC 10036 TaxID=2304196 RepID=UPI0012DACA73|nr:hypothetical protein [Scytonema sp. UIC 10036]MUG95211.1 hypothetical protein [Scytonema sp. UIC 10036]
MTDITSRLDLAPVDYLSQSIVYLSRQKDSIGKAFHLNNPQPDSWSQLADFICSFGYPIKHIAYKDWQVELTHAVRSKENPLYHLKPFYKKLAPKAIVVADNISRPKTFTLAKKSVYDTVARMRD